MALPIMQVDENPNQAVREAILRPLRAFNESQIGPIKSEPVAIVLRDPENHEITGGLWGISAAGWLFVDLLVVPEEYRHQGFGTELLRRAEQVARKRLCTGMWLHTGTFQAPAFHEKLGFNAFGTVPDCPPGHATIYYPRRFEA